MVLSLVIVCVSIPVACGMKWLNLKTVSAKRREGSSRRGKEAEGLISCPLPFEKSEVV